MNDTITTQVCLERISVEQERIAKLETKVEAVQEDVKEVREDIKELHSRITSQTREIVDKIDVFQTRIEHKMAASVLATKEQHDDIQKAVHDDIQQVAKALNEDIREVSKRVDTLEQWRWMILGGAIVIGYVLGNLNVFTKFFK